MEFFKEVSFDWIGKKWLFLAISWAALMLGVVGYIWRGGFAYGIDFTGGTVVLLKFKDAPNLDDIRAALKPEAVGTTIIQRYDVPEKHTVQVRMQRVAQAGEDVTASQEAVRKLLKEAFDPANANNPKPDFNSNTLGADTLYNKLLEGDPDHLRTQEKTTQEMDTHYRAVAASLLDYRTRVGDGMVAPLDQLKNAKGVSASVVEYLKNNFYAGAFAVKGVESVGAVVGADLRRRAALAVGLSFLGMLVYIGFRFKPIYGVAAIVALFHDVTITLGLFALLQKEISLTVVAALLTLVGYSVNDTIVIFDRVRENLRLMRKESLTKVLNLSINQTLSRTIMTSGMTFLSVLALFVFGGEVLNGFSFALTVGIIVGTWSTLAIASPIVDWWYRSMDQKSGRKAA